jgi:hypothetical protein
VRAGCGHCAAVVAVRNVTWAPYRCFACCVGVYDGLCLVSWCAMLCVLWGPAGLFVYYFVWLVTTQSVGHVERTLGMLSTRCASWSHTLV